MTKLLLLVNKPRFNITELSNHCDVYAYMMYKNFKEAGFVFDLKSRDDLPITETYDHCFIAINGALPPMLPDEIVELRKNITGKIITMCECDWRLQDLIDTRFVIYPSQRLDKCITSSWGVDKSLHYPEKIRDGKIRVFVDHAYYERSKKNSRRDKTDYIMRSLIEHNKFDVRHLSRKGIISMDKYNSVKEQVKKEGKTSKIIHAPYSTLCEELRKADIFVVTHAESFGFTIIEAAASGCLVLAPKRRIQPFVKNNIHCVEFNINPDKSVGESIDWDNLVKYINVERSVNMASRFSYQILINDIKNHMLSLNPPIDIDNKN